MHFLTTFHALFSLSSILLIAISLSYLIFLILHLSCNFLHFHFCPKFSSFSCFSFPSKFPCFSSVPTHHIYLIPSFFSFFLISHILLALPSFSPFLTSHPHPPFPSLSLFSIPILTFSSRLIKRDLYEIRRVLRTPLNLRLRGFETASDKVSRVSHMRGFTWLRGFKSSASIYTVNNG